MWVRMLGPLQVFHESTTKVLSAGKHKSLLGSLAASTGDVVSFDHLAELVWDGSPPAGSRIVLRNYVMRIRRILGPDIGSRLVTLSPGYLFNADENEVDLLLFEQLCRDGHAAVAAQDWLRGSALLSKALNLSRGKPFADIPSQWLRDAHVPYLEETRLAALAARIECDLRLGRSGQVIAELSALSTRYPMRERLQTLFVRALHLQGRQADALAVYQRTRAAIVEQLGIEPGTELRQAHQQILSGN